MTKEEIYESYWKQLVLLKRQFSERERDTQFRSLKRQLEQERNTLLIQSGYRLNP